MRTACRHASRGLRSTHSGFRTPVFRWDRISVHLRGLGCDYAHAPASVKNAPSRQSAMGSQVRSQSRHAPIPSPVVTDRGRTRTWGFSERQCPASVSSRTSTYGSRSILLITTRSATENIYGYLSGLSSPSVTDATTTLAASPRSNSAGQTRLPTFSTKTRDPRAGRSSASARASMSASRWQPAPVLIWTTGAPALRIRSASRRVSWSPSTTAIGRLDANSVIVRCSRDVLPEPGELMRLRATMPCSASQARLWSARWSFFASRAVSISTSPGSGSSTCSCTWGWACGWAWPVGCPCRELPASPPTRTSARPQPHVPHTLDHLRDPDLPGISQSAGIRGEHHGRDRELTTGEDLDVGAAAVTQQDQVREHEAATTGAAASTPLRLVDLEGRPRQRGAGGHQLEAEPHRVRHDAREPAHPQPDARHRRTSRALGDRLHHALRDRELVHRTPVRGGDATPGGGRDQGLGRRTTSQAVSPVVPARYPSHSCAPAP